MSDQNTTSSAPDANSTTGQPQADAQNQSVVTQPDAQQAAGQTESQQTTEAATETADKPHEEGDKPRKKTRAEKRIDQLTQQRNAALQQVEALKAQQAARSNKQPSKTLNPLDFETDHEYQAALIQQAVHSTAAEMEKMRLDEAQRTASAYAAETYLERTEQARAAIPDYDEVLEKGGNLPLSETMRDVIHESEKGPQLAYWLCQNPDEAKRIASMPPLQAARTLGQLEQRIQAPAQAARKISKSPPPITTLSSQSSVQSYDPNTGSFADYERWRKG